MSVADDIEKMLPYEKNMRKKVPFDRKFRNFCLHLKERDCLMAFALYYSDMTIQDVLNLQVGEIEETSAAEWVKDRLLQHCKRRGKKELVFLTKKATPVERTHLCQTFDRACNKVGDGYSITPKDLTEWIEVKTESSAEDQRGPEKSAED